MYDLYQVLRQKEKDIERVRQEIEALRFVIPMLSEDTDEIDYGPVPALSVSQVRSTGR
jgi:hypothetical protein